MLVSIDSIPNFEEFFRCSQLILQILENLCQLLIVRDLHGMKFNLRPVLVSLQTSHPFPDAAWVRWLCVLSVSLLPWHCSPRFWLVSRVNFTTLLETPPCSAWAFTKLWEPPNFGEEVFLLIKRLWDTQFTSLGVAIADFLDLDFAIGELLCDMALCFLIGSEKNFWKWLQENIEKFMMFIKRKWCFHSSRVKAPFGERVSKLILGVKQPINCNSVGSWHVSHGWTSAFPDHLDHRFIIFTNVQPTLTFRNCASVKTWSTYGNWSASRFPFSLGLDVRYLSGSRRQFPAAGLVFGDLYCSMNVTLLSPHPIIQKQVVRPYSIQHPTKIISVSVELCDTDVSLLFEFGCASQTVTCLASFFRCCGIGWWFSSVCWSQYFNHRIPWIESNQTIHSQSSIQRNDFALSGTVVCWRSHLTHPTYGDNVRLPKKHKIHHERFWFLHLQSLQQSLSWNNPNRQCWAVLPTWLCCR